MKDTTPYQLLECQTILNRTTATTWYLILCLTWSYLSNTQVMWKRWVYYDFQWETSINFSINFLFLLWNASTISGNCAQHGMFINCACPYAYTYRFLESFQARQFMSMSKATFNLIFRSQEPCSSMALPALSSMRRTRLQIPSPPLCCNYQIIQKEKNVVSQRIWRKLE